MALPLSSMGRNTRGWEFHRLMPGSGQWSGMSARVTSLRFWALGSMVFYPAAPVRVCVCVVVTSSPPLPILVPCRPTRRPLISVDVTQPLRILVTAAVHLIEESRMQFLGDGPAAAAADGAAVHFTDRRHLGGGAGEEGLVGDVHLVAGDAFFAHLDAEVFGQFDHCGAGDAVERRREFGCVDHAVANDEDVFAAALGDIALV